MKFIKKLMFIVLVLLFGWQYGASAFHNYDKNGGLSCTDYCGQYGETEAYSGGVGSIFSYNAGTFDSCWCFTAAEIQIIKNCAATSCGTNMNGKRKAYIAYNSPSTASWCSPNDSQVMAGCSCYSGHYKTSDTVCSACGCGYYCSGGTRYSCGTGKYSASTTATSCTTCPAGKYCPSTNTCTPTNCSAGYYCRAGSSSQTKCPNNPPATSSSGATSINSCYYPKDVELSDAAGTYLFTSNCFYSA